MGVLDSLQPENVFRYFEQICSIPHGSGNVEAISNYLCDFAKERGLWYKQDENFNVIIKKPASNAQSSAKPVILQGHIDMVAVKTDDKCKDMEKEGLDLIVEDGFVRADRTTLGGDDGIAVAYALAVLDSEELIHPPVEAVFTVDEEIGMLGASSIDLSCIDGNVMLNMDSEEEGVFLSGCAGGATLKGEYPVTTCNESGIKLDIRVAGLTSGHSGTDIIFQRANANVIMGRLLAAAGAENISIIEISGGEKDNSIAPYASVSILVRENVIANVSENLETAIRELKNEYAVTDPDMDICFGGEKSVNADVYDEKSTAMVINVLSLIPDGVVRMSNDIKGLVQTSLNLGVMRGDNRLFTATYLIRSSVESEKKCLIDKVAKLTCILGGRFNLTGVYPAWEFKRDSVIRNVICDSYKELFDKEAKVETIHAGVECGIMAAKIAELDCVSFGPDIRDIHTVKERLDIASTKRTWELIVNVLEKLA